jgi:hypothetical protein
MRKILEFNTGTASRGDAYYSIVRSTGTLTNTLKFEGPGEKTFEYGEKL